MGCIFLGNDLINFSSSSVKIPLLNISSLNSSTCYLEGSSPVKRSQRIPSGIG
jgi:hypothetical protein